MVNMAEITLGDEQHLLESLRTTLAELPGVSVVGTHRKYHYSGGTGGPHFEHLDVDIKGTRVTLVIEIKRQSYPRDVREALWTFRGLPQAQGQIPMLVANALSSGAMKLLREQDVGYYDSNGNLFLPAPGAFILIERPPAKSTLRSIRSIFTGSRGQVVHALLTQQPLDWVKVGDVAERAQVSRATASETLSELERHEWVEARGAGPAKERRVTKPGAMLDAWAAIRPSKSALRQQRFYVPGKKYEELTAAVAETAARLDITYAVTHEVAAQRYAPYLTHVYSQLHCRVLGQTATNQLVQQLSAEAVTEGANLIVTEARSPGAMLFRERVGDVWLASPVQVYLDLIHSEHRGRDLAQHLRRERIGF